MTNTWTLVGVSTPVPVASGNVVLTEPAGVQNGDLLVACIAFRGAPGGFTPPAGWTNAQNQTGADTAAGGASGCRMDYQLRNGGPNLTWTAGAGSNAAVGAIAAYRLSGGSTPQLENSTKNQLFPAGTAYSMSGFSNSTAEGLVIMAMASSGNFSSSLATATDPSSGNWTEISDSSTALGADVGLAIAAAVKTSVGNTGNFTWTSSGSGNHAACAVVFGAKYDFPAARGTYTYTGQTANLVRSSQSVTADQGSYTYTGQAVNFPRAYRVAANQGSYATSGQVAALLRGRKVAANQGAYTYTGQIANFLFSKAVQGEFGTYGTIGFDVTLTKLRRNPWTEESSAPDSWMEETSLSDAWVEETAAPSSWVEPARLASSWTQQATPLNTWTEES